VDETSRSHQQGQGDEVQVMNGLKLEEKKRGDRTRGKYVKKTRRSRKRKKKIFLMKL